MQEGEDLTELSASRIILHPWLRTHLATRPKHLSYELHIANFQQRHSIFFLTARLGLRFKNALNKYYYNIFIY